MTGSAAFADNQDLASQARARLDAAAEAMTVVESAQRSALAALLDLWPTSAWLAAGATSAKRWLVTYTGCGGPDAHRLERLAGLCHHHPTLADAVLSGDLPLARAHVLGAAAIEERQPWLAEAIPTLLRLNDRGCTDDDWTAAVQYWVTLVDQERDVRRVPAHSVTLSQRLFGGGEIHGDLSPNAFLTVASALDAWTDDPDSADAPYQRSLGERRADALDDLCRASLDPDENRWTTTEAGAHEDVDWEDIDAEDPFDGFCPTDDLDEHLAIDADHDDIDALVLLRRRLRRAEQHRRRRRRRRTRARSGACINVHVDLRTLAGLRDHTDLDDLVISGDGWRLTKDAADQLLCDSSLVTVLFDGKGTILDANDAAERWSRKQRRAIAARDHGCVFPGCGRPPRFCDIHHLEHQADGGPTKTSNGAMLCRFHHRLLHHHGWHLTVEDGQWVATDSHGARWTGRPTPRPTTRGDPP